MYIYIYIYIYIYVCVYIYGPYRASKGSGQLPLSISAQKRGGMVARRPAPAGCLLASGL